MFNVFFTNFGYALDRTFTTKEDAVLAGKQTGFEFQVIQKDDSGSSTIGYFTVFGGYREL